MTDAEITPEKKFQDLIACTPCIKDGIIETLFPTISDYNNISFEKEVEFINGITADFILINKDEILLSTIECKRADIGVTEYVRGVGQLLQYEYFYEQQIMPRKHLNYKYLDYQKDTSYPVALVIPSEFYTNTKLNIGLFKYPKTTRIIEINTINYNVREISKKILDALAEKDQNTISISSYYMRDNRLFECYLLLKYINYKMSLDLSQSNSINRKQAENQLRNINTTNHRNWRNAFITLSSLGFINSDNYLTISGRNLVMLKFEDFAFEIYKGYIKPYVDHLLDVIHTNADKNQIATLSNQSICQKLKNLYNGKDILFLTESKGRYISSWLNIIRDDLGCISFEPRNKERTINYIPSKVSENEMKKMISKNFKNNKDIQQIFKNFDEQLNSGGFAN